MLVTAAQVINYCFTNKNTDTAFIKEQYIRSAQVQYIRPALGDDFYDLIVAEKEAAVYTGSNQTLIETYIMPCLAFYIKMLVLPDMHLNTTTQGIMTNNSQFANSAGSKERAELAASTKALGDSLMRDMLKYLDDNYEDFPLYESGLRLTSKKIPIGGWII